jgi:hypothetical protein
MTGAGRRWIQRKRQEDRRRLPVWVGRGFGTGRTWLSSIATPAWTGRAAGVVVILAGIYQFTGWKRDVAGVNATSAVVLGLAIMLPRPIAFEYPQTAAAIVEALAAYGIDTAVFLGMLGIVANVNRTVLAPDAAADGDPPGEALYFVLGTPMRGVVGSRQRVMHLAAWRLPPLAERIAHLAPNAYSGLPELAQIGVEVIDIGEQSLASATTAWARVYEARPEVVTARDAQTPASWLTGKRVLILGAGALGAPIATWNARSRSRSMSASCSTPAAAANVRKPARSAP